jgi:hypothetical protein
MLSFRLDLTQDRMAQKTTALEIKMKICVHVCVRVETTGEGAAKALVALQRKSRKKQRAERTYRLECAEGLRGVGTLQ